MNKEESQYSMDFDSPQQSTVAKGIDGSNSVVDNFQFFEEKVSESSMPFAEIDTSQKTNAAYALLGNRRADEGKSADSSPAAIITKPTIIKDDDTKLQTKVDSPTKPSVKIDPSLGPELQAGGMSPIVKHSPHSSVPSPVKGKDTSAFAPAVASTKLLVSQSLPAAPTLAAANAGTSALAPTELSRSVRATVVQDPMLSALTRRPFVDVGLNYALDNIDRISSYVGLTSTPDDFVGSIAGGGSYYGTSGRSMLSANQSLPSSQTGKLVQKYAAETKEAYNDYQQEKDGCAPEVQQSRSPPAAAPAKRPKHVPEVKKMAKSIAGFVSEPWCSTTMRDTNQLPPMELAASLLSDAKHGLSSQPLPSTLAQCLDGQRKSRNAEGIIALAPSVGNLLTKKVLSPLKSDKADNRRRTHGKPKRSQSGGSSRRNSGNEAVLLGDCLELAATEAELKEALQAQIKAQLQAARNAVLEKLEKDRRSEEQLEAQVIEFAEKKFEARRRIKLMQSSKGATQAAKEEDKAAIRDQMLREQAALRAAKAEKNQRLAQERKHAIIAQMKEKKKNMETEVFAKMAESTQTIAAKAQARAELIERQAIVRDAELQKKLEYALQFEQTKTSERAASLNNKDDNFERVKVERQVVTEQQMADKRTKEIAAAFRAEQRRNMLDVKRKAEQELGRIRQTAEAVVAATRQKANSERTIKLNRIYAEQLRKQIAAGGNTDELLDVTPGPGEYFKKLTHDIKPGGGYMASSRPESLVSEIPGPGTYEVTTDGSGSSGCIPFMGRGKTDVDWTILRASKLPGVGQYEVAGKGKSGRSIKLNSKGISQLDKVIDRAKKLPGPGDYNLNHDTTHKAGSLESYLLGESDAIH